MENEKKCYGRIFPSVLELKHNTAVRGHVFGYEIECSGLSTGDRSVVADTDNWRGASDAWNLTNVIGSQPRCCSWRLLSSVPASCIRTTTGAPLQVLEQDDAAKSSRKKGPDGRGWKNRF